VSIIRNTFKHFALLLTGAALVMSGCTAPEGEGFAIYLTAGDIPPARMEALSHVEIADSPLISENDIVTYDAQTHELTLTGTAFERVSRLEVPLSGKSFVVCVDKGPVYWGAFWTPISSMSFDGVTIWEPLAPLKPNTISLRLGYPGPSFYSGQDPRNNSDVMRSLEQAGKLINKTPATPAEELPHSMKGYELYSWEEDSLWYFTLITGTNRNKTLEEIISKEVDISESGMVRITVEGADAIMDALTRLPEKEPVFWCDGMRLSQNEGTDIEIQLPPEPITDEIAEHAEQCGLDFMITTPQYAE